MSGTKAYLVANLLDKMSNEDRDFRYMALNDLINDLQKNNLRNMDENIERKIIRAVLALMNDKNGEVQNLAVKCLGPLVKQIRLYHTLDIVSQLSGFASQQDNEGLRALASMGLKTVITEVNTVDGPKICTTLIPDLLKMLQCPSYEMQMDTLDVVAEVLARYGSQLTSSEHEDIQQHLLPLLAHPRPALRKRTTVAIGYLVVHTNDKMFADLVQYLLDQLQQTKGSSDKLRTLVQCTSVLSRYSSKRFGSRLSEFISLIFDYTCETDEDAELREICLQALESFVLRCPTETASYIDRIVEIALEYLKYDPNFAEEEDDDEGQDDAMEDEEDGDDEYDDVVDYSDEDDDMSWKVRRSASKLLAAVIDTRSDLLQQMYENVAPVLINRFKEREESVRVDIFETFITLLRQTAVYCGDDFGLSFDTGKSNLYFDATGLGEELALLPETARSTRPDTSEMEIAEGPKQLLCQRVPKLTRALSKQLLSKSTQTRQVGFHLLRELVYVLHGGLSDEFGLFLPAIESCLAGGDSEQQHVALTSNLKIEVLSFLRLLFHNHPPHVMHPHLSRLAPAIISTISDRFYKISSEAFFVCIELIKVIRPIRHSRDRREYHIEPINDEFRPYVLDIFKATMKILDTNDADQEVKERSIMCLGSLLAQTGDILQHEQRQAWEVFLDKLKNEMTRLTSIRTLTIVCQSPLATGSELERCIPVAVDEIAPLLRKHNRALRIASTECLRVSIQKHGQVIRQESYRLLLVELKALISDADLHLLPLALRTVEAIIVANPVSVKNVKETILDSLFKLIWSPLLQGAALESLLSLFGALARASPSDYQLLVKDLVDPLLEAKATDVSAGSVTAVANKQAASTVAQCVAVLVTNAEAASRDETVRMFQGYIMKPSTSASVKYLSLLTLGETGRRMDISFLGAVDDQILKLFTGSPEEIKFAAAFALGNVSVGNIGLFLPKIVHQIKNEPKRRYLLLHALKEIITRSDKNIELSNASDEIWSLLLESSDAEQEEGTRSVVAECLGKLALTNPSKFLPQLQERLASPSGHIRATVATAIKYAIVEPTHEYDDLLKPIISQFLTLLRDPDLNVHRLALLTINSAVHRKPFMIKGILSDLIPLLYEETIVKDELIHTVEMGPFKHKVDDGLEIRKAAYECMYTLLATCFDKIDVHTFLDKVRTGLEDQHDIKMLAYLMIIRLAKVAQTAVMQKLDDLVTPLKNTLEFKMRSNAVKQEVEKNQELIRATLRCIAVLAGISDPGISPNFCSLVKEIESGPLANDYKITVAELDNREAMRGSGDLMDLS